MPNMNPCFTLLVSATAKILDAAGLPPGSLIHTPLPLSLPCRPSVPCPPALPVALGLSEMHVRTPGEVAGQDRLMNF